MRMFLVMVLVVVMLPALYRFLPVSPGAEGGFEFPASASWPATRHPC